MKPSQSIEDETIRDWCASYRYVSENGESVGPIEGKYVLPSVKIHLK